MKIKIVPIYQCQQNSISYNAMYSYKAYTSAFADDRLVLDGHETAHALWE